MNYWSLASSWAVLIYLGLGFYVFQISPKTRLNRLFMVWAIGMAEYSLCFSFLYVSADPQDYNFWYKLSVLGWAMHMGLVLHIVLLLTRRRSPLKKRWLGALYGPGLVVLLFRLFLIDALTLSFPSVFRWYFGFEEFYTYIFAIYALFVLWKWGQNSTVFHERRQVQVLSAAGWLTSILSFLNDVLLPGLNIKGIPPMGHLTILVLAGGLWYACIEYQFPGLVSLVKIKEVVDQVSDLIFLVDKSGAIVDYNQRVVAKLGYSSQELLGRSIEQIIPGSGRDLWAIAKQQDDSQCDTLTDCRMKSGGWLPINLRAAVIRQKNGFQAGVILFGQDRTAIEELQTEIRIRVLKEEQLHYLNLHDPITGLFNRNCFEEQLKALENRACMTTGIIVCDIDGLKLVNDTLGHNAGDQLLIASAQAISQAFHGAEIVARIGGDEFAVLIPDGTKLVLKNAVRQIEAAVQAFNQGHSGLHLSLSMGYAVADGETPQKIIDLFKEADNYMYKEKLNHVQSVRNAMIQALMSTLEARDLITEQHTQRIQETLVKLGEYLHLAESSVTNLRLLGQFHDIGKVGIPDHILLKPGPLNPAEMTAMRQHSDIGYRIAKSIPDLEPIAELILSHHERWDGGGYPRGLSGTAIPLECRILAVVDAFDAMTNQRPYRDALPLAAAIAELKHFADSQFDPWVVRAFLELLDAAAPGATHDIGAAL